MTDLRRLTGLLLIAGGLLWVVVTTTDIDDTVVVPGLGLAFLAAYVPTRRSGLLIPAGILTGLGIGLVISARGGPEAAAAIGLGLGFVSVTAIDAILGDGRVTWWPLIPGGILMAAGTAQLVESPDLGIYLAPGAVIVVGLVLTLSRPPTTAAQDEHDRGHS
jgi:hypothetical protein